MDEHFSCPKHLKAWRKLQGTDAVNDNDGNSVKTNDILLTAKALLQKLAQSTLDQEMHAEFTAAVAQSTVAESTAVEFILTKLVSCVAESQKR